MYISNTVSVLFSNTFVSLTGYLYTLQVICTVQVTCLAHIYEPKRLFVHFTGYLYNTSNLFSTHLLAYRVTCNFHVHKQYSISTIF